MLPAASPSAFESDAMAIIGTPTGGGSGGVLQVRQRGHIRKDMERLQGGATGKRRLYV